MRHAFMRAFRNAFRDSFRHAFGRENQDKDEGGTDGEGRNAHS